ncbi:MAG: hypothetical protein FWE91_12655 [Defluviitaleaceae bacterium]|nr:hypothetical protein [Defluviitaleaceae bacterium]MCL2837344.1 hypothetical protein [Defluviitaleaceae bacterium]
MLELIIGVLNEAGVLALTDVPPYIIKLVSALINIMLCFGAYAAFGGFVAQGAVLVGAEPGAVIRNGILVYFAGAALVILLLLTIVLLPIALLIAAAGLALMIFGQSSMAMLIGLASAKRLNKRFPPVLYLLAGLIALNIIVHIPYIGTGVSYIFLPMLSVGITVTSAINGLIKKKFYYAPFKREDVRKEFDRKAMKEIVTGDGKEP